MNIDQTEQLQQKHSKRSGIIATILYILALYPLGGFGMYSIMIFCDHSCPFSLLYLLFTLGAMSTPLSILLAIFLIWRNYLKQNYKRVRFFCYLPLCIFGINICIAFLTYIAWDVSTWGS